MVTKKETSGQCYLFVIAINEYTNIEQLTTPVQSAQDIMRVLIDKYNFVEENILFLCNEEATRDNILHYLREFSTGLTEQDSLIIYYSGHGVIDEWTNEGYWLPVNANEENLGRWFGNYEIKKYVEPCRAHHILVLCDSFFHGKFLHANQEKKNIDNDVLTSWYVKKSRQVIYSGKTPSGSTHDSFAEAIIDALLANKQQQLITSALFSDMCASYIDKEIQLPFFKTLDSDDGGEYFFFLSQDGPKDLITSQQIHSTNKKIGNIEKKIDDIKDKELPRIQSDLDEVHLDTNSEEVDSVIKIFREKEKVENQLLELREIKDKLHRENTRRLQRIENIKAEEIQKRLKIEIEKYNLFISSDLCNEDIKDKAWGLVIRQCPDWWLADEIQPHDVERLILPPHERQTRTLLESILGLGFTPLGKQEYQCGTTICIIDEFEQVSTGIKFSLIPGGTFIMGGEKYDWEKPRREVAVKPFLMSSTIITQKIWQSVMGSNPAFFKGENRPVDNVSWELCQEFCQKTKLELPSESQWEYAARGRTSTEYYWGNVATAEYCWYGDNSGGQTHDVGEKKPNAYGLYDMLGNIWEWCLDTWHPNYTEALPNCKAWIDDEFPSTRVIRGGSYYYIADFCRCAYRGRIAQNRGNRFTGFRVVKSLS